MALSIVGFPAAAQSSNPASSQHTPNSNELQEFAHQESPFAAAQLSNCTYPTGASYFSNLQGRVPSGCYGGNLSWWALPVNGGTLAVSAEACKANVWYVSVKGEKLNSSYGKEARVAGIQGMTGTPEAPVLVAPEVVFNAGTCSGSYPPFHGVMINGNGLHNFYYSGPLQTSPSPTTGQFNPCELGVYRIEFTPNRSDVGKTFPVKVTSQILVTNHEYQTGSYIRESSQIDWNVNITVTSGAACPTIAVNVNPSTKTIPFGATFKFTAGVSGTTDTGVQWSTAGGGTIDQNGNYLAGTTAYTDTITATSLVDTTKSGTAHVTVQANKLPTFVTAMPSFSSSESTPSCIPFRTATPVDFKFVATDPDGGQVTFSLSPYAGYSIPANISIGSDGRFKWDGKPGSGFRMGGLPSRQTGNAKFYIVATDSFNGVTRYAVSLNYTFFQCLEP